MDVRQDVMVPLGYGKFVRSDRVIGLEPIEEDRGPGRRTRVYVDQVSKPLIASRTENAIVASMVEVPREVMEATAALELLKDIHDDIEKIGPMLRKSIEKEANLNLEKIRRKIEEILRHELDTE